jgi:predicted nucleotidyltransferase
VERFESAILSARFDALGGKGRMASKLGPNHQILVNRFVEACQADERIIAALLVGSYVKGKPDKYSDLDLFVITTNEAYEEFAATRDSFVHQLGEPFFMEDFDLPGIAFLIFSDGSEVELSYVRESQLDEVFNEQFQVLLDKKNIMAAIVSREQEIDQDKQKEKLRRLIQWFWHEMSHFTTALGRGQLWWAQGQLEALRSICVNLARLRNNILDEEAGEEPYFKIENVIRVEQLTDLQDTFPPLEKEAIVKAGLAILRFYQEIAPSLAQMHGIPYPHELERVMMKKLQDANFA